MKDYGPTLRRKALAKQQLEQRLDLALAFFTGFTFAMALSILFTGVTS